jgi:hypothetical protein
MTILEPILYANGALRLTRHGAGKGGNIFMHVPSGQQVEVSDRVADNIDQALSKEPTDHPLYYFFGVKEGVALQQKRSPGFYHN